VIPLPPRDPALPGLGTALDSEAMRELLSAYVSEGFELGSCRPVYIRYKPGTSCLVQYRLGVDEPASRRTVETLAQVKLFAGRRAEKLWARGSLQQVAATAAEWNAVGPVELVAHLSGLGAVLHHYPVDPALPALAFAASAAGRRRVLRQVIPPREPGEGTIELVRYKPGRKALFRYGSNGGALYAKVYVGERGRDVICAGRALEAAGVPTAHSLAYLGSLRMLTQAEAAGVRLRELRGEAFERGTRAAGEVLARLHAAQVPELAIHTWADEAAELVAGARVIGSLRPDLAGEAARLAERVVDGLAELPVEPVTTHGDFSDDQVLIGESGAVLLDLDEVRAAHRLRDVGNFLAHLSLRDRDGMARASLLAGFALADGGTVALFEAGALLKLAVGPFRRLEPDWPELVESGVRLAARRLRDSGRGGGRASGRPFDPGLPQLAALTHPLVVGAALESEVYGQPVRVSAALAVKHKPRRRCTLRYDLEIGAERRADRLYGKTFASERGPRVYRTWQAVSVAQAFGPEVALPEPVAHLVRLRLLLQREVGGRPAREGLLAGDRQLAVRIADGLHAFHTSTVRLERSHELEDELRALRGRVEELAARRERSRACLQRLERAATAPFEWRLRPVHRDLYHDQILVDGPRLAMLDFDDAAMSEPAVDVANVLAHLRLLALEEPLRREAVAASSAAFRDRYAKLDPLLDLELVRLLECATLLRLACIHEQFARRLLRECERLLPGEEPPPPTRVRRGSRLALALDTSAVLERVAGAVEARMGACPTTCRARLLRRKKGRAVVLYELETPAGPLTLVGKWFPFDDGNPMVAVLVALRTHGFAGGDFSVPEPVLHEPDLHAVFTEAVAGPSLSWLLDEDQEAARRAGAWLARFHGCGAILPRTQRPAKQARALAARGIRETTLASLAAALVPALRALPTSRLPTHGDFASADVLVPPEGPTVVIDFDQAAMGDPAFDVANFEATLAVRGLRRYGTPEVFASARRTFREGYEQHAPLPPLAPALEALVWLRLTDRNTRNGATEDIWRYTFERAQRALEREENQ
jgi:Ser/Thr protein kinase RdoA (MazF antagonist)